MHSALLLLLILAAGLASQWLAWRLRLPAIVVLISVGLLLGPMSGVIQIDLPPAELAELIGLGVAIILFEGGMDLRLGEYHRVGPDVRRLTLLAPPIAWLLGSLAAHYVAGFSFPVAWVLGAILVVTGPTVILPLLRQARLNKGSASLLKWEGIVNDPIGVLLAVLTFQYFTGVRDDLTHALLGLVAALLAATLFGGMGGWLTGWLFRRGKVPEHLKSPMLMVLVLMVYACSNLILTEAGLLSVTIMGLVVGNMKLVEREDLHRFKANLTVVLLSILFIVIPSQLHPSDLTMLDARAVLFILAILFLVRPASILLATLGAPMRHEDRWLLAWIAPRGIVAAATAGIFGPALVAAGYADAERLLPIVFLVILTTVLAHGLSIGALARRLGLSAANANGLLIVGASSWSCAMALALKKMGVDVLMVDSHYHRLKEPRMAGIDVYYGEILSEHAELSLETLHLNTLLCATDNDFYNALVCKAQSRLFGVHRIFQIAVPKESSQATRRLTVQQRGSFAFEPGFDFQALHHRLGEGWSMQTSRLSASHDYDWLCQRLGEQGQNWLLLGAVSPEGEFQLYSHEHPWRPAAGWNVLCFSAKRAPEENEIPTARTEGR